MFGFYRIALCVPEMRVADTEFNTEEIRKLAERAENENCAVALFPELAVTGYSCADLFHSTSLLESAEKCVNKLVKSLPANGTVFVFGCPVTADGRLFNAAIIVQNGTIRGIVPKSNLPNYREFYEKRYFSSGAHEEGRLIDFAFQKEIPFGTDLLFKVNSELVIGIEICEDMWTTIPPSSWQSLAGATLILNPSASNELVGKSEYRRELVRNQSARCVASYAYVSAGVHESTTDTVCGGHGILAENGTVLLENERFLRKNSFSSADVDLKRILGARLSDSPYPDSVFMNPGIRFRTLDMDSKIPDSASIEKMLRRKIERLPFVPSSTALRDVRCREIFSIQTAGLAKRIEHTHAAKAVIGISGGLDSTLALLVCVGTMKLLNRPASDVIAVTMPGFGTTGRTYNNAVGLCRLLGVELREIPIREACLEHFRSIGHDPQIKNVVYENTQARERTQILLDIANGVNGLAIGTGDLSESAMGWCTYNGDHISMYAVNCSVPKTLIRYVIAWEGDHSSPEISAILKDIIDTPVSPELLPAGKDGEIKQKTEDLIGPYEIHDFFLYHFLKYGAEPEKLLFLAKIAFGKDYPEEKLKIYLRTFLRRFFSQQFKRSCMPDGPKVGSISLSPRGDWRMPSDATASTWFGALDKE